MCYQDLGHAYINRAGSICQGDLRIVDRKPVRFGVENADQPEAIVFTEAVCVRSVLPSCCWLVFQAGPVSMENFQPAQPRSLIHNTDNPNKLLLLWTNSSAGASHVLLHLFEIHHTRTTSHFLIWRSRRTWRRNFLSIIVGRGPLSFYPRKNSLL